MSMLKKYMIHTITLWTPSGTLDVFGKITYNEGVQIIGNWKNKIQLLVNSEGREISSNTKVLLDQPIPNESYLYFGEILLNTEPEKLEGAFKLIHNNWTDGNCGEILYKAYL